MLVTIPEGIFLGKSSGIGFGLFARRKFAAGETLFQFTGELRSCDIVPPKALQVGPREYLESDLGFDDYLNHSCSPNAQVVFPSLLLIAKQPIDPGEEITFDYDTTEWDMVASRCAFVCQCGARNCRAVVRGFRHLSPGLAVKVRTDAAPHILRLSRLV